MRIVLLAAAAALAGCAGVGNVEQLRAQAPQQSDFNVCRMMVMGQGPIQGVASEEASRRRLDCTPHLATIQAMQRQQAMETAAGLQMLQMAQPVPPMVAPPSPTVTCHSVRRPYGAVDTVCN